ncbi:elongation factor G, domain II-domain-containing protein [Phellopilus nigrolimitatus]|nr:elongation factor G, domain II-domain-containing protein [Phellopilus nigrolimitatus]
METDASDFAVGAILSQYGKDELLHPIAGHSTPLAALEPIIVEVSVDIRKGRTAKEGLMQYKNIVRNDSEKPSPSLMSTISVEDAAALLAASAGDIGQLLCGPACSGADTSPVSPSDSVCEFDPFDPFETHLPVHECQGSLHMDTQRAAFPTRLCVSDFADSRAVLDDMFSTGSEHRETTASTTALRSGWLTSSKDMYAKARKKGLNPDAKEFSLSKDKDRPVLCIPVPLAQLWIWFGRVLFDAFNCFALNTQIFVHFSTASVSASVETVSALGRDTSNNDVGIQPWAGTRVLVESLVGASTLLGIPECAAAEGEGHRFYVLAELGAFDLALGANIVYEAYHSSFNELPDVRQVSNMSILPIRTKIRRPALIDIDSGKTTLTKRILYYAGGVPRVRDQEHGSAAAARRRVRVLPAETRVVAHDMTLPLSAPPVALVPAAEVPLIALAFKLEESRFGQLTYVYQGSLKKAQHIFHTRTSKKVKVPRLVRMHSNEMEDIESIGPGEICTIFGVECASGDTFTDGATKYSMTSMFVPEPVVSLALKPVGQETPNFSRALQRFQREDPTFRVHIDHESKETIVSGMGELHLEVYVERMRREYGVECTTGRPQVAYHETPTRRCEFVYMHRKQTGCAGQLARIAGYFEPRPRDGARYGVRERRHERERPRVVHSQHREGLQGGDFEGLAPITGIHFVLKDGAFHVVDSSELAFRVCTIVALREN